MQTLRVASVSLNQTARDWYGNAERIAAALKDLKKNDVAVACFPELCISGYGCEDGFSHPSTHQEAESILSELIPLTKGLVVNFGLPISFRKAVFNGTAIVCDGELIGMVPKKSLAGDGIYYEPRWFKPWPEGVTDTISLCSKKIPIGDLVFDFNGVRVGYEICEEAWTADRPGRKHASLGIDIECNPSASHFAFNKRKTRELFVCEGSRAFGCVYLYSNLQGCESGRAIYDGGNYISVDGKIVARGERFSYSDHVITATEVDVEHLRNVYSKKHWATPDVGKNDSCISVQHTLPTVTAQPDYSEDAGAQWEASENLTFEEFSRAVPFALFDYMRKSRSKGFVVSLSGGCDSSSVSVLSYLAIKNAYEALGKDGFKERLSYLSSEIPAVKVGKVQKGKIDEVVEKLLITVWQETKNNSAETKKSAATVAKALGSKHIELKIDKLVKSYQSLFESAFSEDLTFEDDGLVLQNLQARVRGPFPWMIANKEGKLLLTTSNRTESALGYCTMDGDTAGGLNPIGGVDKVFLRKWLKWMESDGPHGVNAIPELSLVNSLTPSAELLPKESEQKDEDDLGPYEVAVFIELAFMCHAKSPDEILHGLKEEFGKQYEEQQLLHWLVRFFELFSRNQWKRERLAPSFHVDALSLDPRTWCRWPILNGGFKKELDKLKNTVNIKS